MKNKNSRIAWIFSEDISLELSLFFETNIEVKESSDKDDMYSSRIALASFDNTIFL